MQFVNEKNGKNGIEWVAFDMLFQENSRCFNLNKAWKMSLVFYAIQVLCIRDLICCERACYAEELNECLMGRNLCGFVC